MDHETSKPDSSAWVDDRMASLDSSAAWNPDADKAYRELSRRTARPAGLPWLQLSLAGVTVIALVLVVAMLPWSQVWTPSESTQQATGQTQAAQAVPESAVGDLGTMDVKPVSAEPGPDAKVAIRVEPLQSSSVVAKSAEAEFAETARLLAGGPETRCKKTYNCQPIPGTGVAAVEKAPFADPQQLAQAVQPLQEDERTRLERQKIEEARRAGMMASSAAQPAIPQGVTEPVLVHQVMPAYTDEARAVRIQGTVIVDVTVNTDGSVTFEGYRQKLGYGLDESARDAALQWRFRPGTKDGAPVPTRVSLSMHFSLK
jgi:TonB family protein